MNDVTRAKADRASTVKITSGAASEPGAAAHPSFFVLRHYRAIAGLVLAGLIAFAAFDACAATTTECTASGLCYCVNPEFKAAIQEKVDYFRATIAAERAKGKAIGYLSVPLSTVGGGYFGVNRDVAAQIKTRVEARLGPSSAWLLNSTATDADLPSVGGVRAGQAEYLLMWTRILEGSKALGEDFDFVYFAGPSDYASFFGLTGAGDMDKIAAYFNERLANDPDLKRAVERGTVSSSTFRNYYALRASTAFSVGAHDEWNVIRAVNTHRRDEKAYGVANQLPVMFDGRAISAAEFESAVTGGNAGTCKN